MNDQQWTRFDRLARELSGLKLSGDTLRSVVRFLRLGSETPGADSNASLIMLKHSYASRVRAQLWVTPDLDGLPIIQRTGTASPYMSGWALGLDGDEITDPQLQRYKALPFSVQAWRQELLTLVLKVMIAAAQEKRVPSKGQQGISKEELLIKWDLACKALCEEERAKRPVEMNLVDTKTENIIKDLLEKYTHPAYPSTDDISDWFNGQLDSTIQGFDVGTSPKGATLVDGLRKRLKDEAKHPSDDSKRLGNLFKALARFTLVSHCKSRHLGDTRIHEIIERQSNEPSTEIERLVIGGAGDLSMNQYNVGLYRNPNDPTHPKTFIPEAEPYTRRGYHCLVQWRAKAGGPPTDPPPEIASGKGVALGKDLAICELRMAHNRAWLNTPGNNNVEELSDRIEFALYGKLVLREGEIVPPEENIDEFQDTRHVFRLPNLNPDPPEGDNKERQSDKNWVADPKQGDQDGADDLEPKERRDKALNFFNKNKTMFIREGLIDKPRRLFGRPQHTDVWLFEHSLLHEPNLCRLACKGPIEIPLHDLGVIQEWIEYCLLTWSYRNREQPHEVNHPGDFAWIKAADPRIRIWLLPQPYPCNVVAIGHQPISDTSNQTEGNKGPEEAANTLYLLAWGHTFEASSFSIRECAELLAKLGARYALVLDEGQDVFQADIDRRDFLDKSANVAPPKLKDPFEDFKDKEAAGDSLHDYLPVPIVFNRKHHNLLNRTGLRCSVAYWQQQEKSENQEEGKPE